MGKSVTVHHHGHADAARASTRSTSRRRFPSGRAPDDPREGNQDPGHPADVERDPHHQPVRIPTTIPTGRIRDHLYLYTDAGNAFKYAATRPQQWPPNTVGRYRNTDPVLINYLNRLGSREA